MRGWVFTILLGISTASWAGETFLIPDFNPKPIYPRGLLRAGIVGEVRVQFTVSADGLVRDVSIVQSDHPDLAEAAQVAVEQWRFQPWTVGSGKPAQQLVVAPMIFNYDKYLPLHLNQWLKAVKCRDLREWAATVAEHSWADAPVFHRTRAYLTNSFSSAQLPNERRLALIAKLNRRIPQIVRQCQSSPVSRYSRLLPREIRQLL